MKLHVNDIERSNRQKGRIPKSLAGLIGIGVLIIGLCGQLIPCGGGWDQDAGSVIVKESGTKEQLRIFERICSRVRGSAKEITHDHIPEPLRGQLISLLQQAADISPEPLQKKYLTLLCQNLRKEIFKSPPLPQYQKERIYPDIVFLPDATAKRLLVYVVMPQPADTLVALDSLRTGLKMAEDYPLVIKTRGLFLPRDPLIRVGNLICASSDERMVLNVPVNSPQTKAHQFELVLLKDLIDRYFISHIQPLGRIVMNVRWSKKMDPPTYYTILLLHRISHFYGPVEVVLPKAGNSVHERLKDLFYVFEEIRADAAFLANLSLWKNQKLSTDKEKVYPTFVIGLVDRLLPGPEKKPAIPFLIEFNFLLQKGGVFYDLNQRSLAVDSKKFTGAMSYLLNKSLQIIRQGKYEEAEIFVNQYKDISVEIKEVIGKYKKASTRGQDVTNMQ